MKSKIKNKETIKDQKRSIKGPNKLAAAHSTHAMSLKHIGAAFSDYVQKEFVYPIGSTVTKPPLGYHFRLMVKRGLQHKGKLNKDRACLKFVWI